MLDQAGAGSYTFTVHQNPVPAFLELDFADLPSGQNLHGTIAVDKTDLSKGGLLLFPKGALLNADGTFTNASATTNTSQGGGAVTIGNTNQMFDPGEGHFFLYVDDPVAASVAGVGLNQNNADDADTIGFSGTLPQTTAQVEIVQVQGNGAASIKITAYDFTFGSAVDTNAEARDLVTDPLAENGTRRRARRRWTSPRSRCLTGTVSRSGQRRASPSTWPEIRQWSAAFRTTTRSSGPPPGTTGC